MISPQHPGVVVSYPKSGRTWLRFMVNTYWSLVADTPVDNIYQLSASMRDDLGTWWLHLGGDFGVPTDAMPGYDEPPFSIASSATLLVRNMHQTLVSSYHWLTFRIGTFEGTPAELVRDRNLGVHKIIAFYNAWESSWSALPDEVDVITYEMLRNDRRAVLERVIRSLGFPIDNALLDRASELGSFEHMRKQGNSTSYIGSALAPTDPADQRTAKVRRADPLEYLTLFSPDDLAYIDRAIEQELHTRCTIYDAELTVPPAEREPAARAG